MRWNKCNYWAHRRKYSPDEAGAFVQGYSLYAALIGSNSFCVLKNLLQNATLVTEIKYCDWLQKSKPSRS